ncbi:MAG: response regulator transcription factor [Chitinophagaceae bacterium]|nr:response regulator transcription factor [Chitinophagaceae bacterium]
MIKKYQTIIVDDEAPARRLLLEYLQAYPELEVVAICENGNDAVEKINQLSPGLVFLDIQMPGYDGFSVLHQLHTIPSVIFTTAYDAFALKAFDVNAVDYLFKPYSKQRFDAAINKFFQGGSLSTGMPGLFQQSKKSSEEKILVEDGKKWIPLSAKDVVMIQAAGDFTRIYISGRFYLSNKSLTWIEKAFMANTFIKIHRSTLVNPNAIRSIQRFAGSMTLTLIDGSIVKVSRRYMAVFKKMKI